MGKKCIKLNIDNELQSINKEWLNKTCVESLKKEAIYFSSPGKNEVFNALRLFTPKETKVLIIGQDPYPDEDIDRIKHYGCRAHGLAFSFANSKGIIEPPDDSLLNIFKAIAQYKKNVDKSKNNDIFTWNTNLEKWSNHGVLLLNSALTYCKNIKKKDRTKAWEPFVEKIIKKLLKENDKLAVFLWGTEAQKIFLKALNDFKYTTKIEKKKIAKPVNHTNILYKNKNKIKTNNELIRAEIDINIENKKIKVFMTSHPSNNYQSVEKGFKDDAPKHFKACDEFLFRNKEEDKEKYIWLNFPENNQ